MVDELLQTAKLRLAEKGYKWTKQRREIIRVFFEDSSRHISAEEFHKHLVGSKYSFGLATVYRTLEIMVETGLVHKLQLGDGCSRYELAVGGVHLHHHLVCDQCGRVIEVAVDLLDQLEKKIEADYNFSISGHHLKFFGLCSECRVLGKDEDR